MPDLKGQLVVRGNAPFGRASTNPLRRRIIDFQQAEREARRTAAQLATQTSRQNFKYLRQPIGGLRRNGRESTGGRFATHIDWKPDESGVELDIDHLNAKAQHWLILELGTNRTGRMQRADANGIVETRLRTIKSQRGREIHRALVFADGPGGQYSPPRGSNRTEQLFYRDQVTGAPSRRRPITIKREIKGQHFIRKGARTGFRHYETTVLAAARQAFRKGSP